VEAVGETAPGPTVTGVPEPEEWLLIILAAGMLVWFLWNKRRPGAFAVVGHCAQPAANASPAFYLCPFLIHILQKT
jgi:hypothetical protein